MTQREKLIELLDQNCGYVEEQPAKNLADYLLANGVVVLPCKVGDTVYAAEKDPVIPLTVSGISVFLEGKDGSDYERVENFGKTVFPTREEAALKKMEGEK